MKVLSYSVLGLAALLVGAASPALAQTAPSSTATSSASAPAEAAAPAGAEAEVKAKAEAAMTELEAEADKAEAKAEAAPAAAPPPEPAPKVDTPAEPEPEVPETSKAPAQASAEKKADKKAGAAEPAGDQAKNVLVRNIADAPVGKRPWFLSGTVALRGLVVGDEDPENDTSLTYVFQAGHKLGKGMTVFGQLRLTQRFVAEEGDSAFRFGNIQAGVNYIHRVDLKRLLGVDRQIAFFHRASALLPTSRASQNQDLILAPRLISRGRVKVLGDLYFGFTGLLEYRWHEFAEQAGLQGGMNTQAVMAAQGAFEYNVMQHKKWGVLVLGVDAYGGVNFEYANRDGDRANLPFFGWDLYAQYVPFPSLAVGLSLEQGEPVFQSGAWRVQFFDRETTQFSLAVTGRY